MSPDVNFLTTSKIHLDEILKVLKNDLEKNNYSDKEILCTILEILSKSDFSFLTPQEIYFLDHNSKEIWSEYLIYRYKFKNYAKQKIVASHPLHLLVEPVSSCNLRCVMCFQIDESFTGNDNFMGKMDFDLFKKVIDDAENLGIKALTLASRGEPTLHPNLGDMLEYCKGKFFEIKMNTNAMILSENLIHKILQNDVTDLVFSVDSYTKTNYEKIRVNGNFEKVLENIKKFKEIREKSYPNSKCASRVSGVKIDSDQDPKLFRDFWEKYVDHVVMVEMKHRWDTYHNSKEIMGNGPCHILWEKLYVWFDGTCNPCDEDYKSELKLGNVKEKTLKEIWNGEEYSNLRQTHLNNNRKSCFPCDRCPNGS